ncbi:MAG: type II toxin-antitoxin system VapC family toxin [Polyangiaceae bacterium]
MSYLLDTQIFLWAYAGHRRLNAETRRLIASAPSYVSVVSAWETAIKVSIGKLSFRGSFEEAVDVSGFLKLGLTFRHTDATLALPFHHRDPFDRLLLAQAITEGLVLLTADAAFAAYGGPIHVVK